MKGTIVGAWVKTAEKLWGAELVKMAMQECGWQGDRLFLPTEDIDDELPRRIIAYIAEALNERVDDIWFTIGKDNIATFAQVYPAFFLQENLYSFLRSMHDVHTVVVKRIAGAMPPELTMEPISEYEAILSYQSKRGMFGYLRGLLAGAAQHFKENIQTQVIESSHNILRIKVRFAAPITHITHYPLNKWLAFGVLKSVSAKIGVATLVMAGLLNLVINLVGIQLPIWTAIPAGLAAWVVSYWLLKPLNSLRDEIFSIGEHQYYTENTIATADEFESIMQELDGYKKRVKREFIGFKGITDELNGYADSFNTLSERMRESSNEISGVVLDVATAATNQAMETEHAVGILNGNLETLHTIVSEQNRNKDDLETAVDEINKGFSEVQASSGKLAVSMHNFADVKVSADNLKSQATKINEITGMVAAIAGQTNLLALNAAIEAARAGEMGRGFSVVAEEVRKLAEQSHEHSETISQNLDVLMGIINAVVAMIEEEYDILASESKQLDTVVSQNQQNVMNIHSVADNIVDMIGKLEREMAGLNQVYGKIESLAAISEENSAATEEVSAAVQVYNDKLQDMMEKISEFKIVSHHFCEDLNQYRT